MFTDKKVKAMYEDAVNEIERVAKDCTIPLFKLYSGNREMAQLLGRVKGIDQSFQRFGFNTFSAERKLRELFTDSRIQQLHKDYARSKTDNELLDYERIMKLAKNAYDNGGWYDTEWSRLDKAVREWQATEGNYYYIENNKEAGI